MNLNVYSEIARLKAVMLRRPGRELENLAPSTLQRLLFDDIPDLEIAKREHDEFADILRQNGAEVLYLEDLMTDVLKDDATRKRFLDEFTAEADINSRELEVAVREYLEDIKTEDLFEVLASGIRGSDLKNIKNTTLYSMAETERLLVVDPMPNLYFTRDPFATIGKGISLNRMQTVTRNRETLFGKYIIENHPRFQNGDGRTKTWYSRDYKYSIEGGDILVLSDKIVAIGMSQRTEPDAIEILAKNIFESGEPFEKILAFKIPKARAYMHLDTVFTMIDKDVFTIHPGIEGTLQLFVLEKTADDGSFSISEEKANLESVLKKHLGLSGISLIRCGGGNILDAEREQWNDGSNTLAIAPGEVVVYARNRVTNKLLREFGVKVHEMESSEVSRGRGGPRCMSAPLARE